VMQPLGAGAMGETFLANPYPVYTPTAQDLGFAPFHIITAWNVVHDNGEATTLGATVALSTTGSTHSNATLDGLGSVAGLKQSQLVVGPGIQPFTYVGAISGSSVTLSRPATGTASGGQYQFLNVNINHTDGNGIIYDTWAGTDDGCQNGCSVTTYPNQSLILGNVSYQNGGRGIHVFATSNVTIANNSVYANGLDINRQAGSTASDLSQAGGENNVWVNNIAVSVLTQANTSPSCIVAVNGTNYSCGGQNMPLVAGDGRGITDLDNTYSHNVLYGGIGVNLWNNDVGYFGTTDDKASAVYNGYPYDSQAVFKATDLGSSVFTAPAAGNFTLPSGSPAIGYEAPEPYVPTWLKNAGAY
jgi:parallel beta-helix repeat protein